MPPSVATSAITIEIRIAVAGFAVRRCAAAAGVITSVSTSSTPTTWIASAVVSASSTKVNTDSARSGHAAGLGDLGVDAREEQRAVGGGDAGQHDHRDHDELVQLAVAHADDASEEQVRGLGRVALVQAQEQHPHSQPERQHRADRAVALAPAQRQEAQHDADHERAADQPDHRVEPHHERAGGAGEPELRDRVDGEAGAAGDDERADRAADHRHHRAREQGGVDEVLRQKLREHQCDPAEAWS